MGIYKNSSLFHFFKYLAYTRRRSTNSRPQKAWERTYEVSLFTAGSIQPGDMYRDIHGTPLCRTMRALSAIILIPMSSVGSWKMTSWLLRVIQRMRMSTRAVSRVQPHCRASLPQALQIERLLTVPWNAIVTSRIIIFTGISYFVRPVLYA